MPRLPWFGWALVAFVVLNVMLDQGLGIFPLILIGVVLAGVLGRPRPGVRGRPAPGPGPQVPPPGPVLTGELPPTGAGMPTIDVPAYPGPADHAPSGTAYPGPSGTADPGQPGASDTGTDPVVSLGQLTLSRCARELDAAARTGDTAEVARTLEEIVEVTTRLQPMVDGAMSVPGSGRRGFGAGLRRLQREAMAARGEVPAGTRVAQVVRGATAMGQTGRYE